MSIKRPVCRKAYRTDRTAT